MGEFTVYALGTGSLIVDVQWDLLEPFAICVVMPLLAPAPSRLNPSWGLPEAAASSPTICSPSCSKPQSARWSPSATRSGRRSTWLLLGF
jgi:hypothetical protein